MLSVNVLCSVSDERRGMHCPAMTLDERRPILTSNYGSEGAVDGRRLVLNDIGSERVCVSLLPCLVQGLSAVSEVGPNCRKLNNEQKTGGWPHWRESAQIHWCAIVDREKTTAVKICPSLLLVSTEHGIYDFVHPMASLLRATFEARLAPGEAPLCGDCVSTLPRTHRFATHFEAVFAASSFLVRRANRVCKGNPTSTRQDCQ